MCSRLVDQQGYDCTGKAHHQQASSCCGDQVNRPVVADQIEVSGVIFIPISVKAHGSLLRIGALPNRARYAEQALARRGARRSMLAFSGR
jgi:hypothetical protein